MANDAQHKNSLDFDTLAARFADPTIPYRKIAAEAGISIERVRQLYDRDFRAMYPDRAALGQESRRRKHELSCPMSTALRIVTDECARRNLPWRRVRVKSHNGAITQSRIIITGKRCLLKTRRAVYRFSRTSPRRYWNFGPPPAPPCDVVICVAIYASCAPRMFIVPRAEWVGHRNGYVALDAPQCVKGGLWFEQYENRWDIFTADEEER